MTPPPRVLPPPLKIAVSQPICKGGGLRACSDSEAGLGGTVDFAMTPGGLLVHSNGDWPCAVCRPSEISESRAFCLCLNCAYAVMAAASAGDQSARALLDDISIALSLLQSQDVVTGVAAN